MRMPRAISDQADVERIRRWRCEDGLTLREIGRRLGVCCQTVGRLCTQEGWVLPDGTTRKSTTKWQPKRLAMLEMAHRSGLSRKAIARAMGVDPATVTRGLQLLGIVSKAGPWTERERDLASALRAKGQTAAQIAARLKRTEHSVVTQMALSDRRAGKCIKGIKNALARPKADGRTDADRIGQLASRGFTPEGIARTLCLDSARVREVLQIRDAQRQAVRNARRDGSIRLDGMALRRARSLLAQGWSEADVARQVRVSDGALREALE